DIDDIADATDGGAEIDIKIRIATYIDVVNRNIDGDLARQSFVLLRQIIRNRAHDFGRRRHGYFAIRRRSYDAADAAQHRRQSFLEFLPIFYAAGIIHVLSQAAGDRAARAAATRTAARRTAARTAAA